MKLKPVTKLDKKKNTTSKKIDNDTMWANCDGIAIFPIYTQFGAIRKSHSGYITCTIFIFINSNRLSYKN